MTRASDLDSPRRVTAVIVTYRSAALTVDCLRSLETERLHSGIDITAVIVDNASGDYPEIAAAVTREGWDDWAKLIQAPHNGGFAYGNNLGFAHATQHWNPHYLHMLNPDTRIKPGAVRELVDFLERTPAAGIAGSSFENGDGSDWPIAFRFGSPLSEMESSLGFGLVSRLLDRWRVARVMGKTEQQIDWCAGASMMLRRSMLAKTGGMDERFFLYFEETEFCWRARRAGFQTWYVPSSRVIHIAGQSTKLTERDAAPKCLPDYWFESRRRYFQMTLGLHQALLTDMLTLAAGTIGQIKLTLQGRRDRIVPKYLSGVWKHSVLHRRNRALAEPLTPRLAADLSTPMAH